MTQWRGNKRETQRERERERERKEECLSNLVECQRMRDIVIIPTVLNIYFEKKRRLQRAEGQKPEMKIFKYKFRIKN